MIETARLILRPWHEEDREDLARMCADPDVMVDYPSPQTPKECDVRFERYRKCFERHGYCRWALRSRADGTFIGYTGIQRIDYPDHPLGSAVEIGWRLVRAAWGQGTGVGSGSRVAARRVHAVRDDRVLSYTTTINVRSQAVMRRIGLLREKSRDFVHPNGDTYVVFAAHADWLSRS